MNRAALAVCLVALTAAIAGAGAACSSSSQSAGAADGGGEAGAAFAPVLPCSDAVASVYANPGDVSAQARGAILQCAHDQDYTASELLGLAQAPDAFQTPPYSGRAFTSGAHVYRVLYRTERGDPAGSPGYSSAMVLLPDTPRAGVLPVVVASHGSRGQAGTCAPSMLGAAAADVNADFIHQVYPLVGFGFAVIAPDLAGYANFGGANNPPSAYADAADVGKSTLERWPRSATCCRPRACRRASSSPGTRREGTPRSRRSPCPGAIRCERHHRRRRRLRAAVDLAARLGGHLPRAADLRLRRELRRAWSASGTTTRTPRFSTDRTRAFRSSIPPSSAVVQSFVQNDCWSASYPDLLEAGATANDFFTAAYVNAIAVPATPLGDGNCNGRPHLHHLAGAHDRRLAAPHRPGGHRRPSWWSTPTTTRPSPPTPCSACSTG